MDSDKMRILIVNPPAVCSYFNAGHRLPIFQVGAFLRGRSFAGDVECHDLGALNATWRTVCKLLSRRFDVVAVFNDYDGIDGLSRFLYYMRRMQPEAKVVTFGRGSKQAPAAFKPLPLDSIIVSGDYESGLEDYVQHLLGRAPPAGNLFREGDRWREGPPGRLLEAGEWVFPEWREIPYEAYDRLYSDDLDKFCGIPGRRELVVPIARGCPVNCVFCDVPVMQGLKERRVSVEKVIGYIQAAYRDAPFEYVSFYAPTFTLKRAWVRSLCTAFRQADMKISWKCVTTLAHLDEQLIGEMSDAGCVRISVGLETLSATALRNLPALKRNAERDLQNVTRWCNASGVELNCFVIFGLPGDTLEDATYTANRVKSYSARLRPTAYTPYQRMADIRDLADIASYNRQTFVDGTIDLELALSYYRLLYADSTDRRSAIMNSIPSRASGAERVLEARVPLA